MTRILVIEDEQSLLDEILEILRFEGFDSEGAEDGVIGLQKARELVPDLIVCDVMMPEMDGYEVLQELRTHLNTSVIPFIFLTAKSNKEDMRQGMVLGADDYLTKPFTMPELMNAVRTQLAKQTAAETYRLKTYSHLLITMQEHERRKTADILQQELGQIIAGLQVTLEMSKHLPPNALQRIFAETKPMVNQMVETINEVSLALWPAPLDHLGLLPALFWLFDRYTARTGVVVDFRHQNLTYSFTPQVKTGVFRIIQEALENVANHAGVDTVAVRVWCEDDNIFIQVDDNGGGFRLEEALILEGAIGLIGMHERATALNGELAIETTPNQGTHVQVQIPLDAPPFTQKINSPQMYEGAISQLHDSTTSMSVPQAKVEADVNTERQPEPSPRHSAKRSGPEISIVLADDNDITRKGLSSLLDAESEFSVIGEAVRGTEVADIVEQLLPDILVLNLVMPDLGGLEITREVTDQFPETKVLILSPYHEEVYFLEAFRQGATGYIVKNSSAEELVQAVNEVVANRRYLSPSLFDRAIGLDIDIQNIEKDPTLNAYSNLTNREREVFHLVIKGYTSAAIAEELVISPRTAETHRSNMMRKMGVHNHRELLRYALRRGIITVTD